MALKVYYFRNEQICKMLVRPRGHLLGMEPGTVQTVQHSHHLGHEIFPALQGRREFIGRFDGK